MTADSRTATSVGAILWGPATLATFAVLVVPFAVGWLESEWMTPLALPGYVIYVIGSAVGNAVSPRLSLSLYWVPFLLACYCLAVVVGYSYSRIRR